MIDETCPHSEFKDNRHAWTEAMIPRNLMLPGEGVQICYRCFAFRIRVTVGIPVSPGDWRWFGASGQLEPFESAAGEPDHPQEEKQGG